MNGIRNLCRTGLLFVLLLGVISMVLGTIQVEVDGQALSFSEAPRQMNGRTMVPLRGIFEALGAQVNWDASSRLINQRTQRMGRQMVGLEGSRHKIK